MVFCILAIDNNAAERALRGVAVGRKHWLFAGSQTGGGIVYHDDQRNALWRRAMVLAAGGHRTAVGRSPIGRSFGRALAGPLESRAGLLASQMIK